ncbi:MAG: hypothetical protein WDO70_02305 [Alphaproteobacteria bacterium]
MIRTIERAFSSSALLLALGLAVTPAAAYAAPATTSAQCATAFKEANKTVATDIKAALGQLEQTGTCGALDFDPATAQTIASDIKSIVAAATIQGQQGSNQEDVGKVMSIALGIAGQPSFVAADPTLYSAVLTNSAQFAELARDENADSNLSNKVQFARLPGSMPNNNQQPTVCIEAR